MRWLKSDRWKAGIGIAGMLLLLVFMVRVPVSAAGANEVKPGLATPATGTVQATPTVDPTMTALQKDQLRLQNKQLAQQENWLWSNAATILSSFLSTLVLVIGALIGFGQWRVNRKDTKTKELEDQKAAQDKDRIARQDAQDKDLKDKAEERFKSAVTALADEKEGAQIGGTILLRSFLNKDDKSYERYYTQVFDLAVAYLRLPRTSPLPEEDPDALHAPPSQSDTPQPLTSLSQALTMVFKESFPLARDRLKEQDPKTQFHPQSLDATDVRLDNAYLARADLVEAWLERASFREANLMSAHLEGAHLMSAHLEGADLSGAHLEREHIA